MRNMFPPSGNDDDGAIVCYWSWAAATSLIQSISIPHRAHKDVPVQATSYNTVGGCGDAIFYDPDKARLQRNTIKDAMVSSDVSMFQEMHVDTQRQSGQHQQPG